jgi:hypothetical protein
LRERGWGSPNSDEGTYTVILCIQYISTLCMHPLGRGKGQYYVKYSNDDFLNH